MPYGELVYLKPQTLLVFTEAYLKCGFFTKYAYIAARSKLFKHKLSTVTRWAVYVKRNTEAR